MHGLIITGALRQKSCSLWLTGDLHLPFSTPARRQPPSSSDSTVASTSVFAGPSVQSRRWVHRRAPIGHGLASVIDEVGDNPFQGILQMRAERNGEDGQTVWPNRDQL